jgi:UTP--glucose-1-phosphate uridylyltransferase
VVDKPLIQYAVEEAREAGVEHFIFVTSRGKSVIEDHFDRAVELEATLHERGREAELTALRAWMPKPGEFAFVRQQQPLGLGHAVWCARDLVGNEPFAVLLADDLVQAPQSCLKQMTDAHRAIGGNMIAVMEVPREQTRRYGILDIAEDGGKLVKIKGLVEKPAPDEATSTLGIIGRYILQPEIFRHLSRFERGAGNEIQITDALARMLGGDTPFHGFRFEGTRFDCGDKAGFLQATVAFALARADIAPAMRQILDNFR